MSLDFPDEFDQFGWPAGIATSLVWFLGPAANAVRKNLAIWSDYQSANILRLAEKINARETTVEGQVHPRVAQQILAEASWADDDVAQEYFAGMLVGARNKDGTEGDNAYYARLASSLTSDQLRLHHIMYSTLAGIGAGNELRTSQGAAQISIGFSLGDLQAHVAGNRIPGAVSILSREELIGEYAVDPNGDVISGWAPWAPVPGVVMKPTGIGAQLFLKAYGIDRPDNNVLLTLSQLPHTKSEMPTVENIHYAPSVVRNSAPPTT